MTDTNSLTNKAQNSEMFNKNKRIYAFRPNDRDIATLTSLQKTWRITNKSEVLHRCLDTIRGYIEFRASKIAEIKELIARYDVKDWEIKEK